MARSQLEALAMAVCAGLCACNSDRVSPQPLPSATATSRSAPTAPLIRLARAGIDHVLFERRGEHALRLEKRAGKWTVVAPGLTAPADASQVERLFADLDGIELAGVVSGVPGDSLVVRIVAKRGETTVLDAWLGAQQKPRRGLFRESSSSDVWVAYRIAPWIFFASAKDFRAPEAR